MKVKCISLLYSFLILFVLLGQTPIYASDARKPDISEEEAYEVAAYYVKGHADTITEWKGAIIGDGIEYYTDEIVSAYEFKILVGNQEARYMLISARKDWMPVLEYGGKTQ